MAEDFDKSQGGHGAVGAVASGQGSHSRARKGDARDEDKLSQLRKHVILQQEGHKKNAQFQRARDEALVAKWVEHTKLTKAGRQEELQGRLASLVAQKKRALQKSAREGAREANAQAERDAALAAADAEADAAKEEGLTALQRRARPTLVKTDFAGQMLAPSCDGPRTARRANKAEWSPTNSSLGQRLGVRSKAAASLEQAFEPEHLKDLRAHALVSALVREPQDEKKFRAIQQQGHLQEAAERAAAQSGAKQADTSDDEDDPIPRKPAAEQRQLARRYRLRMMHQVAGQVLQCRNEMSGCFQQSFLSPRSPLDEARLS